MAMTDFELFKRTFKKYQNLFGLNGYQENYVKLFKFFIVYFKKEKIDG